jgi:D-alanyl-D-alanine carboxypeptidase/D-alanyl-D-alanine-endopeptidase (penicillin-binding protein 4)
MYRILIWAILGLWLGWIWGTTARTQAKESFFQQALHLLSQQPGVTVGVSLRDLKTGELLAEANGSKRLIPASTMKLLVTSYAMSHFPADQRWTTQLFLSPEANQASSLIIVGSGDPTLGSSRIAGNLDLEEILRDITQAIQKAGIRKIKTLSVNTHALPIEPIPWSWAYDDIGNYFGAPIRALNIADNRYGLTFQPGVVGAKAEILEITPNLNWIQFENLMRTGAAGSGDNGYIFGVPEVNQRWLRGTIPAGDPFTIYGSMPDPVDAFLRLLRQQLIKGGITVDEIRQDPHPFTDSNASILWQHHSPPLLSIIQEIHETSFNLYADALLALTSQHLAQPERVQDWGTATDYEQTWLTQAGIQGFSLKDGSGLSPRNLVTANGLTQLLVLDYQKPWWQDYLQTLSIRHNPNLPAGTIRGKTGFISGIRSLSGVIQTESGRSLAFSILINHFEGNLAAIDAAIDQFLTSIWRSY